MYQDDDIDQAATYIKDELASSMKNKYWDFVITDSTTSYGYCICITFLRFRLLD